MKNSKVLFISPVFRSYNQSFYRSLKDLGYDVYMVETRIGIKKKDIKTRVKRKLGLNIEKYFEKQIDEQTQIVLDLYYKVMPNIVYVRHGTQLTSKAINEMSKNSTTILYLTDTLETYPELENVIKEYDYIYSYDINDNNKLNKISKNPIRTMYGTYDESDYYIINNTKKIYDIVFVGEMHEFRIKILKNLINDFPSLKMAFFGKIATIKNPIKYIKLKFNRKLSSFKNMDLNPRDVNILYNQSKIVLNLQHPQSKNGWCSRTCEIMGSGAFEIVNSNDVIEKELNKYVETFHNYDELKIKIKYYLKHEEEREKVAIAAHLFALSRYTNSKLVEETFNNIEYK